MNKKPRKAKQWAKEAYDGLDIAWGLLRENHPIPNDDQKLELFDFAPSIAAEKRGIKDKEVVGKAYSFAEKNIIEDFKNRDNDQPINYSIIFLLAYLDVHISFGDLTEMKAQDAMHYLKEHYDMSLEGDTKQKNYMFQ